MRFFVSFILIAILAAFAEIQLPWWSVAIVAFIVALIANLRPAKAFGAGFIGIALLWLILALVQDIRNNHILSARMAPLFHLPHYSLFILVTVLVGGLVGGLGAWCGSLVRRMI